VGGDDVRGHGGWLAWVAALMHEAQQLGVVRHRYHALPVTHPSPCAEGRRVYGTHIPASVLRVREVLGQRVGVPGEGVMSHGDGEGHGLGDGEGRGMVVVVVDGGAGWGHWRVVGHGRAAVAAVHCNKPKQTG
jgi:hypothetical protein